MNLHRKDHLDFRHIYSSSSVHQSIYLWTHWKYLTKKVFALNELLLCRMTNDILVGHQRSLKPCLFLRNSGRDTSVDQYTTCNSLSQLLYSNLFFCVRIHFFSAILQHLTHLNSCLKQHTSCSYFCSCIWMNNSSNFCKKHFLQSFPLSLRVIRPPWGI